MTPEAISQQAKEVKLLILDIDGTICGRSNIVSQPVLEAIAAVQAKGIAVAIATGRMYGSAMRFHETVQSTLPLLSYQGAWIQRPGFDRLRHTTLKNEQAIQLLDYFEQPRLRDLISVHFYLNDRLHVRAMTADSMSYCDRCRTEATVVEDLRTILDQGELTKVLAISQDTELIQSCLKELKANHAPEDLYLTTSVDTFLEAANPMSNKGAAAQFLAEDVLGLSRHQVMAMGDNCNDLEMIDYAGIGVAMKGGPAIVQESADWVAPSVDEDGVAQVIRQFLL